MPHVLLNKRFCHKHLFLTQPDIGVKVVVCDINAFEVINGICKYGTAHTVAALYAVYDSRSANREPRYSRPCVYNRRNAFGKFVLFQHTSALVSHKHTVFNNILTVLKPVYLKVNFIHTLDAHIRAECRFGDRAIVTAQRDYVSTVNVVKVYPCPAVRDNTAVLGHSRIFQPYYHCRSA